MKEKQIKQLYESPEVVVYETKVKAVICQSGDGTEQYEPGTWNI